MELYRRWCLQIVDIYGQWESLFNISNLPFLLFGWGGGGMCKKIILFRVF